MIDFVFLCSCPLVTAFSTSSPRVPIAMLQASKEYEDIKGSIAKSMMPCLTRKHIATIDKFRATVRELLVIIIVVLMTL
jgi:hypothetical protein